MPENKNKDNKLNTVAKIIIGIISIVIIINLAGMAADYAEKAEKEKQEENTKELDKQGTLISLIENTGSDNMFSDNRILEYETEDGYIKRTSAFKIKIDQSANEPHVNYTHIIEPKLPDENEVASVLDLFGTGENSEGDKDEDKNKTNEHMEDIILILPSEKYL